MFRGRGALERSGSGPSPPRRVWWVRSGPFAAALLEAVGVGLHLQDVDVMGNAIEQGADKALGTEDLGPLVEGQVAGDDGGARSYLWENTSNSSSAPVCDSGT